MGISNINNHSVDRANNRKELQEVKDAEKKDSVDKSKSSIFQMSEKNIQTNDTERTKEEVYENCKKLHDEVEKKKAEDYNPKFGLD